MLRSCAVGCVAAPARAGARNVSRLARRPGPGAAAPRASLRHQRRLLLSTVTAPSFRRMPSARRARDDDSGAGGGDEGGATSVLSKLGPLTLLLLPAAAATVLVSGAGGPAAAARAVADATTDMGAAAPLYFAAAYAAATVALLPASLLTLAAGALFGPLKGTAIVSAAATSGATISFLLARSAARPLAARWAASAGPRLRALDGALARADGTGARVVLLLRLTPLFPFSLGNYALGLTGVRLRDYVAATWAGTLPGTAAYVYLGSVGSQLGEAAAAGEGDTLRLALYSVGAVCTVLATRAISRAAAAALDDIEGGGGSGAGAQRAEAEKPEQQGGDKRGPSSSG